MCLPGFRWYFYLISCPSVVTELLLDEEMAFIIALQLCWDWVVLEIDSLALQVSRWESVVIGC